MSLAFTYSNGPLLCVYGAQFLALHESRTLGVLVHAGPWEGDDELVGSEGRQGKRSAKKKNELPNFVLAPLLRL